MLVHAGLRREGGALGYNSRVQTAGGSHHFGNKNQNLIHVASFNRLKSKTKLKE